MKIKEYLEKRKGFTLIELLLVIAIIAILALLIFVALNPAKRFKDARDARRFSDVNNILQAVKVDQIDNGGTYLTTITNTTVGQVYLIGTCVTGATASNVTSFCTTDPTQSVCVDISDMVTQGYLGSIPISPNGDGAWSASITGYTLEKSSADLVTIRACEHELSAEVELSR
ncbi:MAG: prepilin-type N-terminal cleavage/methylation domain-containing protein [Candidatus Magasanikbacteria bacterium]|nr:prepilin-type N-terminal cleavage/methylation domain-containing protein [Candidatus Magasanikbacteria bacterium]